MVAVVVFPPVVMNEFPVRVFSVVVPSLLPFTFFPGVVVLLEIS